MNGNFNTTPIEKDENIVTTDTTQTVTGQKQFTGGLYVGSGLILVDNDPKEVLGKGDLVVKDSSVDMTYPLGSSGPAKLIGHAENEGTIELSVEGRTNNQSDGKTTLSIQHDRVTINNNKVATENQVNTKQDTIDSSHKLSADLVDDTNATNKFITASDKQTWNGKQDALVSGTNIKTINNQSILGSGDLTIQGGVTDVQMGGQSIVTNTVANIPTESATTIPIDNTPTQNSTNLVESGGVYGALSGKQDTLTAGTNINISNNTISATDTTYSAGTGISISNQNVISANTPNSINYLTTAPSSANTDGDLKIVVLTSEPATKYSGYIYFITEA